MKNETVEFKVIFTNHWTPSVIRGNFTEIESIFAENSGGQELEMTRFIPLRKHRVKVGQIYSGTLSPKDPRYENQAVNDLKPLNGFGGIEEIGDQCWDYTDPAQEQMEHQAKMEAWGDIHSAVALIGSYYQNTNVLGEEIIKEIIHHAILCREARLELTDKYYKELKANDKEEK